MFRLLGKGIDTINPSMITDARHQKMTLRTIINLKLGCFDEVLACNKP